MKLTTILALLLSFMTVAAHGVSGFHSIQLSDKFHSEGAALADIDKDGHQDVVYGPYWFAGPKFERRHLIYKPNPFRVATYSNNFFTYADDIDGDGWSDILVLGFPGRERSTYWLKNPGEGKFDQPWQKHEVFAGVENESPVWADVTGDGRKEILCSVKGQFGFVAPSDWSSPESPWAFTPIAPPKSTGNKFTHGLGFGDVNGDGRNDLLEKNGWWEQPESGLWIKHPYVFSDDKGGCQMFTYDFDGDGDNDIVSAINAHGYGLAWFEQITGKAGKITFQKHLVMGQQPGESKYGLVFSQLHGMKVADIDGDGIKDIVTGKRYYAHGGKDPGGKDTPVIYWFRTVREAGGKVDFVPYLIHDASGVGVDVTTGDANNDGNLDVIIGNKKGCFVHLQTDQKVEKPMRRETTSSTKPEVSLTATILEAESLKVVKPGGGKLLRQGGVNIGGETWSGGKQLWWRDAKPGAVTELSFPVEAAGNYRVSAAFTKARDYGIVELAIDGRTVGKPIDLYSPKVVLTGPVELAKELSLTAGEHVLTVTIKGKNPKAEQRYMFGLDYLSLAASDGVSLTQSDAPPKPVKKSNIKKIKEGNDLEAKALSPAEQQKRFRVPDGFVVELVASEDTGLPKPTSIAFDDAGRLWSATATEYPRDRDPEVWTKPGKDKVVVIDSPHLPTPQPVRAFADGMVMPMSVLPRGNGVYIAQGPEILFMEDTNGDGAADNRKVLIKGFGVQDTHTLPHQLARMPGGRITFSQGVLNSGTIVDASGKRHQFDKTLIAAINFDATRLEIIGVGMNNIWAWGHSRTGRVFIHEANDKGFGLAGFEEDSSYPSFRMTKIHPSAPLHPPTAKGLDLGGTGFSGIAICDDRSGSYPEPHAGNLLVANPIFGKINAATATLGPDNVWQFEKQADFVTCEDPMFRPVAISFGPDGCLYIVDWYNRIISHNEVSNDHPARDKKRGRIWRVRHQSQSTKLVPNYTKLPSSELLDGLESDNTWEMRAAWHQIVLRQEKSLIPSLVSLLNDKEQPVDTRIHVLWTLEELGHFDIELWNQLLTDANPDLRREAVRALSSLRIPQAQASTLLQTLAEETDWPVRYEILRYYRRAEGEIAAKDLAWLQAWGAPPANGTKTGKGSLTLDGSYQQAFLDFLLKMAETKTQLPAMPRSKWDRILEKHSERSDPAAMAKRSAAVKALVPEADITVGKTITEGLCLTCHEIAGKGVGFAPPLNGSSKRDIDGLITAMIDPNAAVESVFRAYRIITKDGAIFEGFNQSETPKAITLLVMGGAKQVIATKDIKTAGYIDGKSAMPDITAGMTAKQVADIIAYLKTVK